MLKSRDSSLVEVSETGWKKEAEEIQSIRGTQADIADFEDGRVHKPENAGSF